MPEVSALFFFLLSQRNNVCAVGAPHPTAKPRSCSCCEDDKLQPGANPWERRLWGRASHFHTGKAAFARGARSFYLGSGPQAFFRIFLSHGNSCQVKIASADWHVSRGKRHRGFVSLDVRDTQKRREVSFCVGYRNRPAARRESLWKGWQRGSKYRKRKLDLLTLIPNNQFSAEGRTTNLKFPCLRVAT